MPRDASDLAHRLAREAEAVCRHYLSNGRREGRYWLVGDVAQHPGPLACLCGSRVSPKGPAGKWTDAATGEHGDLLDIIARKPSASSASARSPRRRGAFSSCLAPNRKTRFKTGSSRSAGRVTRGRKTAVCDLTVRLRAPSPRLILQRRGIAHVHHGGSLRFHPRCYYRPDEHLPTETWPAMIACVTDLDGTITGVHRTWLDPDGFDHVRLGKAPIDTPRRAMGDLLGNAVRFGVADDDVLVAGEGIETMLSLRCVLPTLPMAAALSANHLCSHGAVVESASALYRPRRRCRR